MKKLLFTLLLAAAVLPGWAEQYPDALYAVGDATSFDWGPSNDPATAPVLYKKSDKVYEGFVNFDTTNGMLKFLVTNAYAQGQWGPATDGHSITNTTVTNEYIEYTSGDPDKKFLFNLELGLYLITADLTVGSESFTFKKWTSSDVYQIGSLGQLKAFADGVNKFDASIKAALTADITGMDYAIGWYNNGDDNKLYSGNFNGNGHTVTLAINDASNSNKGLFGAATGGANIHDVIVAGSVTAKAKVAGIVGITGGTGTITLTNVINTATIHSAGDSDANAAGLVGCILSNTNVHATNCANTGTISGQDGQCAAFAGWTQSGTTFTNCWNIGEINNIESQAQLYRNSGQSTATNCYDLTNVGNQGTKLDASTLASGELCYRLNGLSVTSLNWYQTLGTDNYPVPFSSHGEMALSQNEGWYEISEPWQLRWMAEAVNTKNDTYKSAQIKLINDIDYTAYTTQAAMLGAHLNPFSGTLDGQFHSIKVAFNNTTDTEETALVRQLSEGTVKNLKVTGTITANQKLAGGICASIYNSGTIMNCESAVTIKDNVSSSKDRTHGGILARVYEKPTDVTIKNCLFSGKFEASKCYGCGGVVGWTSNSDKVKITNCLVTGTLGFENNEKNSVIAREDDTHAVLTNCYFTSDVSGLGIVKKNGLTRRTSGINTGELCYLLNGSTSGGTNWTQTIGTDTNPIPFNTSMLVFKNGSDYDNIEKDGDWYKISNANELKLFSSKVNGGSTTLKARLTADITASSDFAPIGNNTNWYKSEFDGAYHTITLALNNTGVDYQGLFGTIADGAYIHDVTVAGSVKGRAYVAGVVAGVRGKSGEVNIFNCKNEATITGTGVNAAGIVGVNMNESNEGYCTTNISYCSNTGNVTGGSQSALISGWIGKGSITYSFASGEITGEDPNKEFTRYQNCSFGENSTTTNVTMTGSASTGGAKYFNPADATYSIGDVETFLTIATMVNVGGLDTKNFTLTSDIDLTDKTFIPIGTASYRYKGTFDGGGNKVTLDIDNVTEERQGLFGYATGGATFQNLIVDGTVNCGGNSAALIGEVGGPGQTGVITIRKVGCEATVTGHGNNVGAFIGNDWGATMRLQVENSYNIGDVSVTSGNNYSTVMGFWVSNTSTFTNVYNSGNLSGGSVFQFAVYNGNTGNDTYTNCYLSPTSDQLASGELCYKLGAAFTQDLSQANSYPTFGSETVGGGQWFGDDYIYYNIDESGNITVNELNLDDTKTTYNVPAKVTAKSVTLTRTLHALTADGTQSRWNTFCSPVAIAKSNFSAAKELTGVTANGNNYSMTFKDVEGDILEAGKPYMVQVSEGKSSLKASNVAVAETVTPVTINGLTFTGNFTNGKAPQGSFIISNNVFYNVDSDVTLKAFRGYITTTSGNVKALTFDFEDDATGISLMEDGRSQMEDGAIYNLAGQRINKMQRGINIVNGKKILK